MPPEGLGLSLCSFGARVLPADNSTGRDLAGPPDRRWNCRSRSDSGMAESRMIIDI